ncbi:hypothetical protein BBJ28_00008846 [Nothophytophthora sp. Chile5]|nr:hypothetical protein BBJ28_00008846 [Nothophytophthora sp. Chile5]
MPRNDPVTYAGWVFKEGSLVRSWKKRFLVCKRAELAYYKNTDEENHAQLLGAMTAARIERLPDITNGLLIHGTEGRQLKIFTDTKVESDKCFAAISQWCRMQNTPDGPAGKQRVGWLEKEGQHFRTWKKRYFVLSGSRLMYAAQMGAEPLGGGRVIGARRDPTRPYTLAVTFEGGREMRLGGKSEVDIDDWHKALRRGLLNSQSQQQGRASASSATSDDPRNAREKEFASRQANASAATTDSTEDDASSLFGAAPGDEDAPPPYGSVQGSMDDSNGGHFDDNGDAPELFPASSFRRHIVVEVAEDNTASFIEVAERESEEGPKPYSPTAPGTTTIRRMRLAEQLLQEELEEERKEAMLKENTVLMRPSSKSDAPDRGDQGEPAKVTHRLTAVAAPRSPPSPAEAMALSGIDGEYAGWVYKQGSLVRNWKKRFMVLRGRQLTYYDTAKVTPTAKAKGSFQVITVELSTDIQNGLLVHGRGGRVLKLYTASAEATSTWYNMILEATSTASVPFAPPDRFSTLSSTASTIKGGPAGTVSVDLDEEMELLDRLESLPLDDGGNNNEQVTYSGWLKKEGARVKSWKRRYFSLRGNALSYFNSEDTGAAAKGYGHVRAVEVNGTVTNGLDITFDNGRVLRVSAKTSGDMEVWLCQLSDAIEAANAEQSNIRQSLAARNSFRASSMAAGPSPTVLKQQYQQQQRMQQFGSNNAGVPMRHSLVSVPSTPMGTVVERPVQQRRTAYERKQSSASDDSYLSSELSSQFSSLSYSHSNSFSEGHAPVSRGAKTGDATTTTTHNTSGSSYFETDSDDEYESDESEGDWI